MHNNSVNWLNVNTQMIENKKLTQRRLIDKQKRGLWLKWRRSFLEKSNTIYNKPKKKHFLYFNNINVKIVEHKPIDDKNMPASGITGNGCCVS